MPFPKPENYDQANYELLGRVFDAVWPEWFDKFDLIPNRKTDTNNHGTFSSDFIGMNYGYPEATYERRKKIIQEHENYQKGLLYYVANDPRVPKEIHDEMQKWGLAKDEFQENGNWSRQLYIREARRMIGVYVTTENDVLAKREVPQPVGMGSYAMDSHNAQRYVTSEGFVQDEGDIGVSPESPYSISYGSIIPKKEECTNLLIPICVSSSHIAYGSIRMEPVFMILGQSAAVAACCVQYPDFILHTQAPLIARCITNEKQGRGVFYRAMITEGIVALIWAAIGMAFYNGVGPLNEVMVANKGNAAFVVNEISNSLLGKLGGALALLRVVAAPITSGDTASRSARLIVADFLNYKQGPIKNRLLISIPLFVAGYGLTLIDFAVIWHYFAWSNQTLAMVVL